MKTTNSFHLPSTVGPAGVIADLAGTAVSALPAVKALFTMPADAPLRQATQPGNASSQFPALAADQQITAQNAAGRVSVPDAQATPTKLPGLLAGLVAATPIVLAAAEIMKATRAS
jgi:hypothetical protein